MASNPWEKDWSHDKLYATRFSVTDQKQQDALANAEHAAFAKEAVAENPAMAVPLLAAIPAYQAAKVAGLTSARSNASIDQAADAYRGVQEGLKEAVGKPWEKAWGKAREVVGLPPGAPREAPTGPWVVKKAKPTFDKVFENLIQQESGGKHTNAKGYLLASGKGAQGITQVMANTGVSPGYGVEPIKNQSKEEYIRFGKDYLKAMLNEFGGDMEKALAAYNAGPGNVQKAVEKGGRNWKDHLPKKSETLPYIRNIMSSFQKEDKPKKFPGMVEVGNIDLTKRPVVRNKDGSISTVRSIGINIDNQEVLIPTVSDDGKLLTDKQAIDLYKKTGKHLGKFSNVESSNTYAEKLHLDQEKMYEGKK